MAANCNLGSDLQEIKNNLLSGTCLLSKSHRLSHLLPVPCGEAPSLRAEQSRLGIFETDLMNFKLLSASIADLHRQTGMFDLYKPEEIGLFLGTTTMGGLELYLQLSKVWPATTKTADVINHQMQDDRILSMVSDEFPIRGFSSTFSSACSSGALAILEGALAVKSGMLKACIAGGFDVLSPITLMGFDSLQVVDHDFTAPLTAHNRGINLADGGGLLFMSHDKVNLKPIAKIRSGASISESYHMTKPEPNGRGMLKVMSLALQNSELDPSDISYINAHGTGTASNDTAELKALSSLFGATVPYYQSSKKCHGHTLAGAGALESVLSILALQNFDQWQKTCFGQPSSASPVRFALNNSFGFGGSNTSLVIERLIH